MRGKGAAEGLDRGRLELDPRRHAVAAEAAQVLGAGGQPGVQVVGRDAPARPPSGAVLERDRPRTGRCQRSTSRDATIPTTPGCQPSPATTIARPARLRRAGGVGGEQDAGLGLPAVAVQQIQLACHLLGARAVLGQQQLERGVGAAHPAGGVEAWAEPEAERVLRRRSAGSSAATAISARRPGLRVRPSATQALAHDAAVLAPQRHEVADGGERGEVEVLLGARAGPPWQRLRELQRDPGGAQLGAAVAAQRRVHDDAVRQHAPRAGGDR